MTAFWCNWDCLKVEIIVVKVYFKIKLSARIVKWNINYTS